MKFKLVSPFKPTGDQPQAIKKLSAGILAGKKHQVLLGVTGSGKTFTMASVIGKTQKPTLIMSPNKTLAWQLYQEFQEFFPNNAVEYFVSYYDYYQPEAYIPQSDTYIEKDARINEKIDQMRHQAVQSLLTRNDVIVIASISCIYNLGSPKEYQAVSVRVAQGQNISRQQFLHELVRLGYTRNDIAPGPGNFSAKGAQVKVHPSTGINVVQLEFDKNTVCKIMMMENAQVMDTISIFPAHFWITPEEKLRIAVVNIKQELQTALADLRAQGKLLEAQRLESRTNYDLELMEQTGWCHGIENYSSHLEFRPAGSAPYTLLDYFAESQKDFLTIIDESHLAIPQVGGMYFGDKARKTTLVDYGFRLPSAKDNRPLKFSEFENRLGQRVYVSATPGHYEYDEIKVQDASAHSTSSGQAVSPQPSSGQAVQGKNSSTTSLAEQVIRPTGLIDPSIEIRSTKNQMKDAIAEVRKRVAVGQRVLVVTITKRLAEDIAEYLAEEDIKTAYLHSEIHTLERPKILRDLRLGVYDVLVGINLLREGLDLPETSLVIIFDADKEGFLRNETTLIQTMGRAARHLEGHVIMYADAVTGSMKRAISEVERRRKMQIAHNIKHNITPRSVEKKIYDMPDELNLPEEDEGASLVQKLDAAAQKEIEKQMKIAAKNLDFERAAELRDKLNKTRLE